MKRVSLIALLVCLFVGVLRAEIITVEVTAEITQFEDYGGYFDDSISIGTALTMIYSYDSETLDSDSQTNYAVYNQMLPHILIVQFGDYNIQSNATNLDYGLSLSISQWEDTYNVWSSNNTLLGNALNSPIYWQIDYSAGTLESTDLPITTPDITPINYIHIGDGREFEIFAEPISVEIIPEPITFLTLGLGSLIVRIKKN